MPAPRVPTARLIASGAGVKNPGRMKGRAAPKGDALGRASLWLPLAAKEQFNQFRLELPWLKESHRAIVDMAALLRAQIKGRVAEFGIVDLKAMQELRRILGQLGATPADESKITLPDDDTVDPDDAFLGATKLN